MTTTKTTTKPTDGVALKLYFTTDGNSAVMLDGRVDKAIYRPVATAVENTMGEFGTVVHSRKNSVWHVPGLSLAAMKKLKRALVSRGFIVKYVEPEEVSVGRTEEEIRAEWRAWGAKAKIHKTRLAHCRAHQRHLKDELMLK